MYIIIEGSVN